MWFLYGTDAFLKWNPDGIQSRELLATFSSRELAEAYVEKSLDDSPGKDSDFPFKRKSILASYKKYEIEENELPHDPEI